MRFLLCVSAGSLAAVAGLWNAWRARSPGYSSRSIWFTAVTCFGAGIFAIAAALYS